jgi:hypothetical protein
VTVRRLSPASLTVVRAWVAIEQEAIEGQQQAAHVELDARFDAFLGCGPLPIPLIRELIA